MTPEGLDVLLSFHIAQGHIGNILRTLKFIQGTSVILNAMVQVVCVKL